MESSATETLVERPGPAVGLLERGAAQKPSGSVPEAGPSVPRNLPPEIPPGQVPEKGNHFRGRRIARVLTFGLPCILYLVGGALLAFRYANMNGDAQARLANAYYVLFSRDPHVAAIGFVWNPLPSISMLPLLPFKVFWPALTTRAFAGNITSAIFMAAAVYQIDGFLRDLKIGRFSRIGLVAIFALNPMIVYYGANGMSEAIFMVTLVVAARYLARWLTEDRSTWLVVSAIALALAYMARNEAAFAACFAAVVVVVRTFTRSRAVTRQRVYKSLTDGFIYGLPFAVCFIGWAVVSWMIVGHPFEQFQSVYGTTSQLRVINELKAVHFTTAQSAGMALHAVNSMAPLFPLYAVAAVVVAARKKDLRCLATLAILGGVLLFAVVAYTAGQTAGWYRYYIMTVPLVIMLTGSIISGAIGTRSHPGVLIPRSSARGGPILRHGLALVVLLAVASNIPSTMDTMEYGRVASEEQLHLNYVLHPDNLKPGDVAQRDRYAATVKVANALDALHLPNGAVLLDNFTPCVPYIVLDSKHPQQFVIPNDQDFQAALADPVTFHVRYLMVPPRGGYGDLDAVNRQYPTLYDDGANIATPAMEWRGLAGCPNFRLWKISVAGPA